VKRKTDAMKGLQFLILFKLEWPSFIDAHGMNIHGKGCSDFCKNPGEGGSRVCGQNCLEGSPILGIIAFLLTSLLKFAYVSPPPTPCHPPSMLSFQFLYIFTKVNCPFLFIPIKH
jgi:hypothetical protein